MSEPILSPLTHHVLELFGGPLRDVRFPDADADRLTHLVDEAQAAHEAVVRAELAVQAAREALEERRRAADKQAERTVAYARVYAADRPELLASIDAMTGPTRHGRRGRPRKTAVEDDATSKAAE